MIRHKDYLLVTVPEGAKNWVHNNTLHSRIDNGQVNRSRKPLPPGSWQLIGLAAELTEEQWREIVGVFELAGKTGFQDYNYDDYRFPFETATLSGMSLLNKNKLSKPTTVILKLIQP